MTLRSFALSLALSSSVFACGAKDEGESLPEIDCAKVTVPTFAEVNAFKTNCVICHGKNLTGPARQEAPAEWNFDDYESASSEPEEVVAEVYEGAMPPPASNLKLSDADKQQVYAWGLCGAKP
jgi:cytochrome c5